MDDHDTAVTSSPVPTSAVLRDGTPVALRPMRDDDGERLLRFHHSLSAETQYLRFFGAHPSLSEREVEWFTHVDHRHREAIVAELDGDLLGVARLDRLPAGTGVGREAEVAFVVADRAQGQGLGHQLLAALVIRARQLGLACLVADTLPHNRKMLAVFRRSGLPTTRRFEDGVVRVTMALGPTGADGPEAARPLAQPLA
jgi:RimJ/RimL family protein N-acetyltransferase